ncbi:MAG: hypothetical protein KJZ58_05415 [Flavobacteriales bacterium]|nr:hypothetical protein [Flavobacteriales bacterium]
MDTFNYFDLVKKFHTTIWIPLVGLLIAGCWPRSATAQVAIQAANIESGLVSPRTFLQATLFNAGAACAVTLEGDLLTGSGEQVLHFATEPFKMPAGGRTVMANELAMQSFTYGAGAAGRSAQRFQRLPGGDYNFCIRLHAPQAESGDEFCDKLIVEDLLFLDLVQPWDGDTIDETRPPLTWMLSGPTASLAPADIRLVLVPLPQGKKPGQAVATERPLFMLPHVQERTIQYPAGVADLERGKCYAWQVERLDGTRVVDRSEPWGFCVRKHQEPVQNKYVRIDRQQPGAVYEALDRKIFFRYDEPYSSTQMDCSIWSRTTGRINPELLDDAKASSPVDVRSVGVNLYMLDLQPYGLKPGYYDLLVRNEKGRTHTLKFHVAR